MLRKFVVFILISACFILQCTVFNSLALASIIPNLLIVITSSFGFMRGQKSGLLTGLVCGMFIDVFFGDFVGFYSLVYMYIGYLNGYFHKIFFDEDIKLPMVLITVSDFVYGLVIYFFLFLMRGKFEFNWYLMKIIIPEVIYTVIVTVILYPFIRWINRKLTAYERRSESKFV